MVSTGQVIKQLLQELAQTEKKTIPPFQADKVQRALQEIKEHNNEMTQLIEYTERKVRNQHFIAAASSTSHCASMLSALAVALLGEAWPRCLYMPSTSAS